MKEICSNIRKEYRLYERLIGKEKVLDKVQIVLEEGSNSKWQNKSEELEHDTSEVVLFEAAKQKYDLKYGLRIFIKQFHPAPVFYFDSDGPSHNNSDGKTKLSDTSIRTPHINYYDERGIKKAKRTDYIEKNELELKNDMNLGMNLFCTEANINKGKLSPLILANNGMIDLFEDSEKDIHLGINFIDGN